MSEKERIAKELDQFLLVKGIHWQKLPQNDLERLILAFRRLKSEFEELIKIADEVLDQPLTIIEDSKGEWRHYCV